MPYPLDWEVPGSPGTVILKCFSEYSSHRKTYSEASIVFSFARWRKSGIIVADMGWEHSHPNFEVCHALTRAHENLNNFIKCHEFKT